MAQIQSAKIRQISDTGKTHLTFCQTFLSHQRNQAIKSFDVFARIRE